MNARSESEVSAIIAKDQQRETKKDAVTSLPSWPALQRSPAGSQAHRKLFAGQSEGHRREGRGRDFPAAFPAPFEL